MPRDPSNSCLFIGSQALPFFLVLAGNMESKVFRGKGAHFEEAGLTSMLKP